MDEGDSITVSQQQAIHGILLFQRAIQHLFLILGTWLHLEGLNEIGVYRLVSSIRNFCYLYARTVLIKFLKRQFEYNACEELLTLMPFQICMMFILARLI